MTRHYVLVEVAIYCAADSPEITRQRVDAAVRNEFDKQIEFDDDVQVDLVESSGGRNAE